MKYIRALIIGLCVATNAHAQFTPGQVLTAAQLNAQFARYLPLAGGVMSGPLSVPSLSTSSPVPISSGGTGATSASAALANLGGASLSGATFTGVVNGTTFGASAGISSSNNQSGNSANQAITANNNGGTGVVEIFPAMGAGNFNSIVGAGDAGIITGPLGQPITIAPHSTNATGLRITDTGSSLYGSSTLALTSPSISLSSRPTFNGATPWDSANFTPPLAGTTGSIGGAALVAGACSTGTVAVAGATTAMSVVATPATFPGAADYWRGWVSSAGTVTVAVCAVIAGTPTASTYNVRVIP